MPKGLWVRIPPGLLSLDMAVVQSEKLLKCARRFVVVERNNYLPEPYCPEIAIEWRGLNTWAIVLDRMEVLNKNGDAEWEPSPSNRDDEFLSRTRFTLDEAWAMVEGLIAKHGYKPVYSQNE